MKIKYLKNKFFSYYQELSIVFLTVIIYITNLTQGSYLLGWDSLQTELDPVLGIQRAFFSAWQEFQSFGLAAGMAHAADLIRAVFILPLTYILPNWLVRYSFHTLMLLLAGMGMLKLLRSSGLTKQYNIFALVGSVFYMFNYAATQIMYIPFEAFSVFFASLPWLLWIYLRIITKSSAVTARDWILFMIINILATPSFVAQQLFVVYSLILFLMTCGLFASKIPNLIKNQEIKNFFSILKRSVVAATIIIAVNAFWILPQAYFLYTNGDVVSSSKINQIATADVLYSNIDRGHLTDFLSFTGFFNDRLDQNQNLLFANWHTHRENPVIIGIIILTACIMLLGLLQKSSYRISFGLIGLLVATALLGSTLPFNLVNDLIRSQDIINQIFRSPFTKFAIPHALIGAYFFTFGAIFLASHLPKTSTHLSKTLTRNLVAGVSLFMLIFQAFPVFQGHYFSPTMKVAIPQEYFSLMSHLKTKNPNTRVGILPDYTFWGWLHADWGYNGSGFLWYGLTQPIVSRNFDYWSSESEGYFWELKQAVESEDLQALEAVLAKYDIDYLLFDKSLLPLVADQKSLQYDVLESMLEESEIITSETSFGFLNLFAVKHETIQQDFVSLATDVPNIGPRIKLTNDDTAYKTYGLYHTDESQTYDSYFPFLDLMTQTKSESTTWKIQNRPASFSLTTAVPKSLHNFVATSSSQTTIDLYEENTAVKYLVPLQASRNNEELTLSFPHLPIDSYSPEKADVGYCLLKTGTLSYTKAEHDIHITTNGGATGCIEYKDTSLDQRYGYLVTVSHQNSDGLGMYFYILDTTKEQAYVEDRLTNPEEYYILGPHFSRGLGYSFTFQNTSYRTIPSTNTLRDLSVYLMPYDSIKSYELKNPTDTVPKAHFSSNYSVTKESTYRYTVSYPADKSNQTLILAQSYQPGWKAYNMANGNNVILNEVKNLLPFIFAEELTNHVEINNWANGWNITTKNCTEDNCYISLMYLPQYLQYAGFAVLALSAMIITVASFWPRKHKRRT